MIYTCRPHSFTLERGPQEVNHVRYGVFRQCWYVCHPTLTDDLGSNSFQLQYQMSHANFELLLNIVSQHQVYEMASNNNSYPIEIQVATVLWCFVNTHFGYCLTEQFLGVSAGSYTQFTMRFITAMSDYSDKFVNWRVYDSETGARRAAEFEQPERHGVSLSDVIGAIYGKLISIQKPFLHGNSWVNCHNNSSINILAVCNANKCFIFVRTGQSNSAFPIMENILPPYPIATSVQQEKWRFLLRHLYFLDINKITLTIITCCALHNFCLDNNNTARNISEDTLCNDDDVEIEVEDLDPFMNEIPVDLENASQTVNISVKQLQSAHDLSQESRRQRRERMTEVMRPLMETQTRQFQADF
ncbi:hypothetical protein PHYBLDRAFT_151751 [Phycomyces blakesleeanus NRRL 1555(-)]|uniref:DDE Tnp4 domain-containing protein n=1 Tax=Phycomyces blakesleeanus (strain ATCC 8743b / DSM 1359 / FGSC 10004 / NBRC 33097 / NRRL 1555) TaxID=763407 RepID=A0A162WHH6_PHYB8|nr:hypothetical protein PHYBLDRAFT_151751 [Phycomyces blakesleeanus NRRL 1555(-)]OAD67145.1 hypothetical protein PHYBLDRAFT_151751 [Phycomyces blakesleeanus NRRL 1555(-)]|eukprot:XP_018285185.1 hypothetical protein PHYBLDRAFT_151751 [Phycomyces blakesleeanus NRRL 1555(-)]